MTGYLTAIISWKARNITMSGISGGNGMEKLSIIFNS
jgi:hypothetical protein